MSFTLKNKLAFFPFFLIIFSAFSIFFSFTLNAWAQEGKCQCTGRKDSGEAEDWVGGQPCSDDNQCLYPCRQDATGQYVNQDTVTGVCEKTSAATPSGPPKPTELVSPIKAKTVPELIGSIIKTALGIVGALALLMFVFGGLTWLTSGGSPDKIKKGRDILIWAVIGLVVIFASYTLVDFVLRAFGV